MWPALSVAFLFGVLTGAVAVFIWVAETLIPAMDRVERRLEKRRIEYWVRRDDAARNDFRSEL